MEGRLYAHGVRQMKKKIGPLGRTLAICYSVVSVVLFLYSYTQVDLGLTLSRANVWQTIQKAFQSIGYFNRPVSALIYLVILAAFFILYGVTLLIIGKKKLSGRELLLIVGVVALVICLSYPAFSYDFFNYLFTAKTVLIYHKNPYTVIPLQFTGVEPWLSFMHWTHLPTAYTPLWILVTLLPYVLGFGYFLLTLWSLKIVVMIAYLATAVAVYKILMRVDRDNALLGVAIFALNPLIIVECLVSGHNDILMMALALWSIVLFQKGKRWTSWLVLSLSVAMKLMTLTLIPAFFIKWNRKVALACMVAGFLAVVSQREVLGWYWVWIVPFVALLPDLWSVTVISTGVSLGLLLRYAPFLYQGDWNGSVPFIKTWGTIIPIVLSIVIVVGGSVYKKFSSRRRTSP
jgi:Gpi18-like mannosyltransferase